MFDHDYSEDYILVCRGFKCQLDIEVQLWIALSQCNKCLKYIYDTNRNVPQGIQYVHTYITVTALIRHVKYKVWYTELAFSFSDLFSSKIITAPLKIFFFQWEISRIFWNIPVYRIFQNSPKHSHILYSSPFAGRVLSLMLVWTCDAMLFCNV